MNIRKYIQNRGLAWVALFAGTIIVTMGYLTTPAEVGMMVIGGIIIFGSLYLIVVPIEGERNL